MRLPRWLKRRRTPTIVSERFPDAAAIEAVHRELERWTQAKREAYALPLEMSYACCVTRDQEGSRTQFTIRLLVQSGLLEWEGKAQGPTLDEAVQDAIRSIRSELRLVQAS